jgi:uncharacterized membrane protein
MKAIIILHIIAGTLGLASGAMALFAKKGSNNHKKAGRFFAISMYVVCLAAMVLHIPQGIYFLPSIGVFSLYMAWSGARMFKIKKVGPTSIDKAMALFAFMVGILMILVSIYDLFFHQNSMAIVLLIFGAICLSMGGKDYLNMRKDIRPKIATVMHLGRMGGAYIAAVTALLVVNAAKISFVANNSWIHPILWILPSIVGSLLITRASLKYR